MTKLQARAIEWLENEAKYGAEPRYARALIALLKNAAPQGDALPTLPASGKGESPVVAAPGNAPTD
jgi:hypothetical protein